MKRTLAAAIVTAAVALGACGDDQGDDPDEAASATNSEAPTMTVSGIIKVDALGAIDIKRNPDRCVATGELGRALEVGSEPVVITAPDGREIAQAEVLRTRAPIAKGGKYYVPGRCDFFFVASEVPVEDGVYRVEAPEVTDAAVRFEHGSSTDLVLKVDG